MNSARSWKLRAAASIMLAAFGCGGRARLVVDGTTTMDAGVPRLDAQSELDAPTALDGMSGCDGDRTLPSLASAAQLGVGISFVGMAPGAVSAERSEAGITTRYVVTVDRTGGLPVAHPIAALPRPSLKLSAASPTYALFCDATDCPLFELQDNVYVASSYPALPPGPWREVDELPSVSVRSNTDVCLFDGTAWQVLSLGIPAVDPAPCVVQSTVRHDRGSGTYGLTSDGWLITGSSGDCCVMAGPFEHAIDVDTFYCGQALSLWVVTPTDVFGWYDCGHD